MVWMMQKCITSKSGKIRRNRGIYEFKGTKVMHKNITFILFYVENKKMLGESPDLKGKQKLALNLLFI